MVFRFGVCCVSIIDGKGSNRGLEHIQDHQPIMTFLNEDGNAIMVNYNNTYLRNPDYPSSYDDTIPITYEVIKIHDGKVSFLHVCLGFSKKQNHFKGRV